MGKVADVDCCEKPNYRIQTRCASFLAGIRSDHKSQSVKRVTTKKPPLFRLVKKSKGIRDVISGCGSIDEYEVLDEISSGAYGSVHRACHRKSKEIVAMKKEFEGLSEDSLREIDILRSLSRHHSTVEYKQVVVDDSDNSVYVVMEYLENDLFRYMVDVKTSFPLRTVKRFMRELLEGVEFLHRNRVMHRDLKPSNILMNSRRALKICDFGLSRKFGSEEVEGPYSPLVVTIWYRAPELLLGEENYSYAIDMWSVGCIMAELFLREALFKGDSEIEQLKLIYSILGTPSEAVWPGFSKLPGSKAEFVEQPFNLLRSKFEDVASTRHTRLTDTGFDLLQKMLAYDPEKRITAEAALRHCWFDE